MTRRKRHPAHPGVFRPNGSPDRLLPGTWPVVEIDGARPIEKVSTDLLAVLGK